MNAEQRMEAAARALRDAVYQQASTDSNWEAGTVRDSWYSTLVRFEAELAKVGLVIVPGVPGVAGAMAAPVGVLPIHDGNNYLVRSGDGYLCKMSPELELTSSLAQAVSMRISDAIACAVALVKIGCAAEVVINDGKSVAQLPSVSAGPHGPDGFITWRPGTAAVVVAEAEIAERFQVRVADGWVMVDPKLFMVVVTDREKASSLGKEAAAAVLNKLGALGLAGVPVMVGQE